MYSYAQAKHFYVALLGLNYLNILKQEYKQLNRNYFTEQENSF